MFRVANELAIQLEGCFEWLLMCCYAVARVF